MTEMAETLTIGELAARAGVATSAVRYYESLGLVGAERTAGNQRRYPRAALRRVAFIRAAQQVGVSLDEIASALATLPRDRTPARADWARLSGRWRARLDERIAELERLRDELSTCIGCGCLSLDHCSLLNPWDTVGRRGPGPRYLLGDPRPRGG